VNESAPKGYPPGRTGWSLVGMLTVAYFFSYADRSILTLLVESIKLDLELSDSQIGLLLGPAFAVFYATMGLPFGWLADRFRRTWLVGCGFVLWTLATFMSGLSRSFPQLFAARMAIGVGEATLSPCAMSLIADSFPAEKRGRPIAVYSLGIVFGSSVAYVIGAYVLEWARGIQMPALPLIGVPAPWQIMFLVLGVSGLIPALIFFFFREPRRIVDTVADETLRGTGMHDVLRYVGRHWKVYLTFILPLCAMTIIAYALFWLPAMFQRSFGWPPEQYALYTGIVTLPLGLIVYWLSGSASDRWSAQGRREAPMSIIIYGTVLMAPLYVLAPLIPNALLSFATFKLAGVGIMMMTAVAATALLNITPARIRGQVVALYYMTISVVGLFVGPTAVGLLSQHVFGEQNLNLAISAVAVAASIAPVALIPATRRLYRGHMELLTQE
jgi:MFS family permease